MPDPVFWLLTRGKKATWLAASLSWIFTAVSQTDQPPLGIGYATEAAIITSCHIALAGLYGHNIILHVEEGNAYVCCWPSYPTKPICTRLRSNDFPRSPSLCNPSAISAMPSDPRGNPDSETTWGFPMQNKAGDHRLASDYDWQILDHAYGWHERRALGRQPAGRHHRSTRLFFVLAQH